MLISASSEAIELVLAAGGRLYVWPARSVGCQPLTRIDSAWEARRGRTFHRADFGPFALHLAVTGPWPQELVLDVHRGRVRALWNGDAWAI